MEGGGGGGGVHARRGVGDSGGDGEGGAGRTSCAGGTLFLFNNCFNVLSSFLLAIHCFLATNINIYKYTNNIYIVRTAALCQAMVSGE